MSTIRKEVEIAVQLGTDLSAATTVLTLVSGAGVQILACRSYRTNQGSVLLMVADDAEKTERVLEEAGYQYKRDSVVLAAARGGPGVVARIAARLRATGIGVLYSYASSSEDLQSFAVFKTSDDERAVGTLGNGLFGLGLGVETSSTI